MGAFLAKKMQTLVSRISTKTRGTKEAIVSSCCSTQLEAQRVFPEQPREVRRRTFFPLVLLVARRCGLWLGLSAPRHCGVCCSLAALSSALTVFCGYGSRPSSFLGVS